MTIEEAQIIGRIIGTADGGCSTCIAALANRFNAAGLGFVFTPTDEPIMEQPDWSENPEDVMYVGNLVSVAAAISMGMPEIKG